MAKISSSLCIMYYPFAPGSRWWFGSISKPQKILNARIPPAHELIWNYYLKKINRKIWKVFNPGHPGGWKGKIQIIKSIWFFKEDLSECIAWDGLKYLDKEMSSKYRIPIWLVEWNVCPIETTYKKWIKFVDEIW